MKALKVVASVLLILALLLGGAFCVLFSMGLSGQHVYSTAEEGDVRIACIGDSITYGHGVKNWYKNNYPAQLDRLLGDGYCVNNYGHSGATLQPDGDQPYVIYSESPKSLEFDPDIVILMIGSNDSKPENWKSEAAFKEAYIDFLNKYMNALGGDVRIILCTPATAFYPDGETEGLTNYDISPSTVNEIAEIVRSIASEEGLELIDINALTKDHPEYFLSDNVHPNNDGAEFIANTVYDYLINKK